MPGVTDIQVHISNFMSRIPSALEVQTMGFIKHPVMKETVAKFNGGFCLSIKTWKKEINANALKAKVQGQVDLIEEQGRVVSNKEKAAIRDQIVQELLPNILPKPSIVHLYYIEENKRIIVDTTSTKTAELSISLLRKAFGSLIALPTEFPFDDVMLGNLEYCFGSDERVLVNEKLTIGNSIKLKGKGRQSVTISDVDMFDDNLTLDEIHRYITGGFAVKSIELNHVPLDVTFNLVDGYKLNKIVFESYLPVGSDVIDDWMTDSYLSIKAVMEITSAINETSQPISTKPVKHDVFGQYGV
jgi:recombination associated protein RdgC